MWARATEAAALTWLETVARQQGEWQAARARLQAGLALAQECGDVQGQG